MPLIETRPGIGSAGRHVAEILATDVASLHTVLCSLHHPTAEVISHTRAAVRRVRYGLHVFDRLLDADWAASCRAELRALVPPSSAVRRTDAILERLAGVARDHRPVAAEAVAAAGALGALRQRQVAELRAAAARCRCLASLPEDPRAVPVAAAGDACLPARLVFPGIVYRPMRNVRRFHATGHRGAGDLRQLRAWSRKCLYAAEVCGDLVAGSRRLLTAVRRLNDDLDALDDAERLVLWAEAPPPGVFPGDALRAALARAARNEWTIAERLWPESLAATVAAGDRVRTPAEAPPVVLGGGVVLRRPQGAPEVLVVHDPDRDRWALPRGRAEPGEDVARCAAREVAEETGIVPVLLGGVVERAGRDGSGRSKVTSWWLMTVAAGAAAATGGEVDDVRWATLPEAFGLLGRADRDVLEAFLPWRPAWGVA